MSRRHRGRSGWPPASPHEGGDRRRDESLFFGLREDRPSGLTGIMRAYWSPLVEYAAGIVRSRDAAEDIAQEAFVRLWERRARWRPSTSLRALLYRITRNLALDEQRQRAVRGRLVSHPAGPEPVEGTTPAHALAEGEFLSVVDRAIAALPPRRREVFLLARFQCLSYREIAEVMGISAQTVANHMAAALSDLRRSLAPYLDDSDSSEP